MLKYEIETKKFSELKDKIEIPKFQRGLVWGKEKKHEFIRTLKSGLPIGVLLLSKKQDKYLVIDGLQRFTTMKDYASDFFSYIGREEITDTGLMSIIVTSPAARSIFDGYQEDAKKKQFEAMRDIIIEKIRDGQSKNINQISTETAQELCKKIAALPEKDIMQIQNAVYNVIAEIFSQAQIDDITIPLIIFKGKEDELANIFQKLNQEGVRLTKYDVFAATWIDHSVIVKDDPKFIEYIINKYEAAQRDSDLDIADYDPDAMKQNGELTVFEYAFAVGKALMDKCKKLFPKMDDKKIDSIGFLILAELMGLTYQKMGQLAETMVSYKNLDFKKLKDAILEVGMIVENALTPYIDSPTKPKKGNRASLVCHSELQLASYIIVLFKLKYELTPENGLVPKSYNKKIGEIKKFLYKHYLYDILRGFWSGSGDSKLEEIIADPEACRYTKDVSQAEFEMTVSSWLKSMNKKATMPNVSTETKLFLNVLLRARIPDVDKHSFDIEHCVPKDVLRTYYAKKNIIVPVSPVCNLIYIPSTDNRSKGEQTYYQRQDKDPGTFKLNQEQLNAFVYPERQALRFVESVDTLTEKNYFSFLDNREKVLLHEFMKSLYTS